MAEENKGGRLDFDAAFEVAFQGRDSASAPEAKAAVSPAPAPAAVAPPEAPQPPIDFDAAFDVMQTQKREAEDNRLRYLFSLSQDQGLDHQTRVLELAKGLGVAPSVVETNVGAWEQAFARAQFDPVALREQDPGLVEWFAGLEPRKAQVVIAQQSIVSAAVEKLWAALQYIGSQGDPYAEGIAMRQDPQALEAVNAARASIQADATESLAAPREQREVELDQRAAAAGFGTRVVAAYSDASRGVDVSKLGFELMIATATGGDTFDLENQVRRLEMTPTSRSYGQSALEQPFIEAATFAASQFESLKAGGVGAVAGAGIGAGLGVVLKSPAAWRAGGVVGLKLGTAASSFRLESGGAFLEFRRSTTDDGKPVSPEVALGAAMLYGSVAAMLEVDALSTFLPMFGAVGDAIKGQAGKEVIKELITKNPTFRQRAAEVFQRWGRGALGEAKEEGLQSIAQDISEWVARSAEAGEVQSLDVGKVLGSGADAAWAAFQGGLVIGGAGAASSLATAASQSIQEEVAASSAASAEAAQPQAPASPADAPPTQAVQQTRRAVAENREAVAAGKQVEVIAQLAGEQSNVVRGAPDAVAERIRMESEKWGEPITTMYVDAGAFGRLFQSEGPTAALEAAQELLGEDGPRLLQEAMATGDRLEVPLEQYLDRFGKRKVQLVESEEGAATETSVAEALAPDTTFKPGLPLPRDADPALDERIRQDGLKLAQQYQQQNVAAESEAEARFVDALTTQVQRTRRMSKSDARRFAQLPRAMIRTQALAFGQPASELFRGYALMVERGEASGETLGPQAQPIPFAEAPNTLTPESSAAGSRASAPDSILFGTRDAEQNNAKTETLAPTTFQQGPRTDAAPVLESAYREAEKQGTAHVLYYQDPTTGLLGPAAMRDLPVDPERPNYGIVTFAFKKPLNDTLGHEALNDVFRAVARALHAVEPTAAKVGGDLWLPAVKDQAEMDAILELVREEARQHLPAELQDLPIIGAVAPRVEGEAWAATVHRVGDTLGASVDAGRAAGTYPGREDAPASMPAAVPTVEKSGAQIPDTLRERWASLPPRQAATDIYIEADPDGSNGVLTKAGWDQKRAAAPRPFVVSADVRAVATMDRTLGHASTDELIAVIRRTIAQRGGASFDAAHVSGDEFMLQADSREAVEAFLAGLREELQGFRQTIDTGPGGIFTQDGLHFAYGIAEGLDHAAELEADGVALPAAKLADPRDKAWYAARTREATAAEEREYLARIDAADGSGLAGPGAVRGSRRPGEADGLDSEEGSGGGSGQRLDGLPDRVGEDGSALNQDELGAAKPRGSVEFLRDSQMRRVFRILLNPSSDLSTLIHEWGHVTLEVLGDLAERPDAPEQVKKDWAETLKFIGAPDRASIQREHHEKFARGAEAYIWEGKAPSASLRRVFERFKLWMREVYRSVRDLDVELNDEIRGVFDRLLASEAETARARERSGAVPLPTAEMAGATPEEHQATLQAAAKAWTNARLRAERAAIKEQLREQEGWWKERRARFQEEAERDYRELPGVKAWDYLRTGQVGEMAEGASPSPVRLERAAVERLVGPEKAKALRSVTAREGASPDDVASLVDFDTGQAMLEAVLNRPQERQWTRDEAEQRMRAAFPEVLQERERIEAAAQEALHEDINSDWLLKQFATLWKRGNLEGNPPVAALRVAAREIVARKRVREVAPGRVLDAERSAARKSMRAAAKGEWAVAAVHTQEQVLNHFVWREATEARKQREKLEGLAQNLRQDKARARLGKANPALRDGADALMEAVGLKEPVDRETPLRPFREVVGVMESSGLTVAFDADLVATIVEEQRDLMALTVAEMREVLSALTSIRQVARDLTTALVDGKREDKEKVVSELVGELANNLKERSAVSSSLDEAGTLERLGGLANQLDGALLKPETMIGQMGGIIRDGHVLRPDQGSTWWRAVMAPLQEAKGREADLTKRALRPILDALKAMPKGIKDRLMDPIDGAALFPDHIQGMRPPSRRMSLLMLALNWGNEGNRQRLMQGRNITEAQVQNALNLLTKEEMDWVQTVLDALESLWPLMRDLEERQTGLAPEKVEATPIVTRHGTYRGGYFPAVYDRRVDQTGEKQAINSVADFFDANYMRPGTTRGHLKSRVQNFSAPISLDLSIIPAHVSQAVHDISYREPIRSVAGLLLDPQVSDAMKRHLGEGKTAQLLQWLKDVGGMRGMDAAAATARGWDRLMSMGRSNLVIAALGYAWKVASGDFSAYLIATREVGAGRIASAMLETMGSVGRFLETRAMVLEKSAEMRAREAGATEDLRREMRRVTSRLPRAWHVIRDNAFILMEWSDRLTATPLWVAGYRDALARGLNEKAAISEADAIVRRNLPSMSVVDKAGLLRNKGFMGHFVVMFSYMSTVYNQWRDDVEFVRQAPEGERLDATSLMLLRMGILFTGTSILANLLMARGPDFDEDDDAAEKARKAAAWAAVRLVMAPVETIPVVNMLAASIEAKATGKYASPRVAPGTAFIEPTARAVGNLWDAAVSDGDVDALKTTEDLLRVLGLTLGAPVRPATDTVRAVRQAQE